MTDPAYETGSVHAPSERLMADGTRAVRRRRVYFISGFDPRGPRHYHQLWKEQAEAQFAVDGRRYTIGPRIKEGPFARRWTVEAEADGAHVESRHIFLRWDDLVRQYWPASRWKVAARLPAFYWHFWRCGALGDALRRRLPSGLVLLAPVIHVVLALVLALGASWGVLANDDGWPGWVSGIVVGLAVSAIFTLALVQAERIRLFWLSRIHIFMVQWGREQPDDLDRRWEEFANLIQLDLLGDAMHPMDEVLIVGHSVGAAAAVAVAAHWLKLQPDGELPPVPVKLVTLGQVIPMVARVREAAKYREQLAAVRDSKLPWLDITAPSDLLCYALKDPFFASGMEPTTRPGYAMRSARFDRMFETARFRELKKDFFRTHFQYLMATQRPVDNDWFQVTCGPRPVVVEPQVIPAEAGISRPVSP